MTRIKKELKIEKIDKIEDLEAIKEDWNFILENNETKTVELSYEWQISYWKNFNNNSELFVLVVKDANSIVAIAPLKLTYIRKFGIKVRMLEFIAGNESNYQDFIIRDNNSNILEYISNYLIKKRHLWDVCRLVHLPETSTTVHFFLRQPNRSLLYRICDIQKCIFLKIDNTWEEYDKKFKKARKKIAYRMNKLKRRGEIKYFQCLKEEQFKSNFLKFFELHRIRWNQTRTPSHFNDKRYCKFYLEIIPQLLPKRQICLFVLQLRKIPVAFLYCFLLHRSYIIQLVTYNTAYSNGSPSLVLTELFVKQAFADGIEIIDFGDYFPYKKYWANRFKNKLSIEIYPKRIFPYFIHFFKPLIDNSSNIILRWKFINFIAKMI